MRTPDLPSRAACLLALGLAGCSSMAGRPPGMTSRLRTFASSGERPLLADAGSPSSATGSELAGLEPRTPADGRISGRVVDERGEPVAGIEVRLADGGSRGGRDLKDVTDDSGAFTLKGLRPGASYQLVAEEDGQEGAVGRASAKAPNGQVKIRLVRDDPGSTEARAATASEEPASRVQRASGRAATDETQEPTPRRRSRVNEEDLPPAEEAEALTSSTASAPGRPIWKRVGAAGSALASADRSSLRDSTSGPSASPRSPATAPAEEEANPLPPAKEPPSSPAPTPEPGPAASPRPAPATESANPPSATTSEHPSPAPAEAPASELPPSPFPGDLPASPPPEPKPAAPTPSASPDPSAGNSGTVPSTALNAEAAPKKKTTWQEVTDRETAPVRLASSFPRSVRRSAASPSAVEEPGTVAKRSGLFASRGRAESEPGLVAASCQFDSRKQRIVDFVLPDLNGKPIRFRDLDSDFVLLDFWGTWCGPCRESIPHLVDLQKQYGEKGLTIVGVASEREGSRDDQARTVDDLARKLGIDYPLVLSGADGKPCPLQAALHIQRYPTMILVDRTGQIRWRADNSQETTLKRLDHVLARVVEGPSGVVRR